MAAESDREMCDVCAHLYPADEERCPNCSSSSLDEFTPSE